MPYAIRIRNAGRKNGVTVEFYPCFIFLWGEYGPGKGKAGSREKFLKISVIVVIVIIAVVVIIVDIIPAVLIVGYSV